MSRGIIHAMAVIAALSLPTPGNAEVVQRPNVKAPKPGQWLGPGDGSGGPPPAAYREGQRRRPRKRRFRRR